MPTFWGRNAEVKKKDLERSHPDAGTEQREGMLPDSTSEQGSEDPSPCLPAWDPLVAIWPPDTGKEQAEAPRWPVAHFLGRGHSLLSSHRLPRNAPSTIHPGP